MLTADLRILSGKFQGKVIPLATKKFLVGREQDCQLRPNSELVSRHHCVFTIDDYVVRLRDLGSTNGTFVNDELIRGEVILNPGDLVRIGKLDLELIVRAKAAAPVPVGAAPSMPGSALGSAPGQNRTPTDINIPLDKSGSETTMMSGLDTSFEIPVMPATQAVGDTTIIAGSAASQQVTLQSYPQSYPSYPQQYPGFAGQPYPGQVMPGQQYPGQPYPGQFAPQGYPQYPPGYYPQQTVAMPTMTMPAIPASPAPAAPAPIAPSANPTPSNELPVKLPPPEETGVKEAPAPAPKPAAPQGEAAAAPPPAKPSQTAMDIIKQYRSRKPGQSK